MLDYSPYLNTASESLPTPLQEAHARVASEIPSYSSFRRTPQQEHARYTAEEEARPYRERPIHAPHPSTLGIADLLPVSITHPANATFVTDHAQTAYSDPSVTYGTLGRTELTVLPRGTLDYLSDRERQGHDDSWNTTVIPKQNFQNQLDFSSTSRSIMIPSGYREAAHPSQFGDMAERAVSRLSLNVPLSVFRPTKAYVPPGFHSNGLSVIFFGRENIDYVQSALIKEVQRRKGYVIGKQSEVELTTSMRSVYAKEADVGSPIKDEIERLDGLVVDRCAAIVVDEIRQYLTYKPMIGRNPVNQLPLPLATTSKGENKLRSNMDVLAGSCKTRKLDGFSF